MGKQVQKKYEKLHTRCKRTRMLPKSLQDDYITSWTPSRKAVQQGQKIEKCNRKVQSRESSHTSYTSKQSDNHKNSAKIPKECKIKLVDCKNKGLFDLTDESKINSEVRRVDGKTFVTFKLDNCESSLKHSKPTTRQQTAGRTSVVTEDGRSPDLTINRHDRHTTQSETLEENVNSSDCDFESDSVDDEEEDEYDDTDADENYEPERKRPRGRPNKVRSLWNSSGKRKHLGKSTQRNEDKNIYENRTQTVDRRKASRKRNINTLSTKLAVLKKQLVTDSVIPLTEMELTRTESNAEGSLHLKTTKAPVFASVSGENFEILSPNVLKGSYENENSSSAPMFLQGLSLASQSSTLLGPFKVIEDPFPHLEMMSRQESRGVLKPDLEEATSHPEVPKKQKRPMTMNLKWPKTGILGDKRVAMVDHDYFKGCQTSNKETLSATERQKTVDPGGGEIEGHTESQKKIRMKNVIELSRSDDDFDSDDNSENEEPMIVISNLKEASLKFYKKDKDDSATSLPADSLFESVNFEDVPSALEEITVGISGKAITHQFKLRNKVLINGEKIQSGPVEKTSDGIVIESVPQMGDGADRLPFMSFTCRYCIKILASAATLYSHAKVVHSGASDLLDYLQEIKQRLRVRCPQCVDEVWLLGYQSLAQHTRQVHQQEVPSVPLVSSKEKVDHRKKRYGIDSVMLCHQCPATFKSKMYFEKHLAEHVKGEEGRLAGQVSLNGKESESTVAKSDKPQTTTDHFQCNFFRCDKCQICLHTEEELEHHKSQAHSLKPKSDSSNCSICLESFDDVCKLNEHKMAEHDGRVPIHCPFCVLGYHDRLNLYRHISRVHLDISPHRCPKCSKLFDRLASLDHHLHKHHQQELGDSSTESLACSQQELLECPYCPKVFMSGNPLVQHLLDTHQDMFLYKCSRCRLCFLTEDLKQNHIIGAHRSQDSNRVSKSEDVFKDVLKAPIITENQCFDKKTENIKCVGDVLMQAQKAKTANVIKSVEDLPIEAQKAKTANVIKSVEDLPIEAQKAVKDLQERGKSAVVVVNFHEKKDKTKSTADDINLSNISKVTAKQSDVENNKPVSLVNHFYRPSEIYSETYVDSDASNLQGVPICSGIETAPEVPAEHVKYVIVDYSDVVSGQEQLPSYTDVATADAENQLANCVTIANGNVATSSSADEVLGSFDSVDSVNSSGVVDAASYMEEYVYGVQPSKMVEDIVDDSTDLQHYEEVITIPVSELAGSSIGQGQQIEILSGSDAVSVADFMRLIGDSNLK